jgi:transcription elongation factor Elf1
MSATPIESPPCPHENLVIHRTNRRIPAHCGDCGAPVDVGTFVALVCNWIEQDRARMDAIEARLAAVELPPSA